MMKRDLVPFRRRNKRMRRLVCAKQWRIQHWIVIREKWPSIEVASRSASKTNCLNFLYYSSQFFHYSSDHILLRHFDRCLLLAGVSYFYRKDVSGRKNCWIPMEVRQVISKFLPQLRSSSTKGKRGFLTPLLQIKHYWPSKGTRWQLDNTI